MRARCAELDPRVFWATVAVAAAALVAAYAAAWLNTGAFAGAAGLLAAVAFAGPRVLRGR